MDTNPIVLVFDTETTGVGPNYYKLLGWQASQKIGNLLDSADPVTWSKEIDKWDPTRIAQLSYILYNMQTNEYKIFNKYIRLPSELTSSLLNDDKTHPIILATLRAAQNLPDEELVTMEEALVEFMSDFEKATIVAAHNVQFDTKMILSEIVRLEKKNNGSQYTSFFSTIKQNMDKFYCTMCASKLIVNIDTKMNGEKTQRMPYLEKIKIFPYPKSSRWELVESPAMKPPALWEVYDRMFGYPPLDSALHDAIIDVVICLRVFYRLWTTGNHVRDPKSVSQIVNPNVCGKNAEHDIYGKDKNTGGEISKYIDDITPSPIDPSGNFAKDSLNNCYAGQPYSGLPGQYILAKGGKKKGTTRKTRKNKNRKQQKRQNRNKK